MNELSKLRRGNYRRTDNPKTQDKRYLACRYPTQGDILAAIKTNAGGRKMTIYTDLLKVQELMQPFEYINEVRDMLQAVNHRIKKINKYKRRPGELAPTQGEELEDINALVLKLFRVALFPDLECRALVESMPPERRKILSLVLDTYAPTQEPKQPAASPNKSNE